ncbi:hypothetical protein GGTG_12171 [Gaeumannomyces tritici R3-111a-1]|uniref:Uncharacterized protein n=1 Tax=Gaeumannomyces tritici (strain R3-111a-1) TaxID=644352 RepID=J3PF92_GAET3|nr:hypothetical protein GGTG_12171 [Gaeumannomyces tritici R3-111a-1]EJT69994.1 hypothetical protein GGTG_12171 [Gaeumannomyces tritici R3-111a-1]
MKLETLTFAVLLVLPVPAPPTMRPFASVGHDSILLPGTGHSAHPLPPPPASPLHSTLFPSRPPPGLVSDGSTPGVDGSAEPAATRPRTPARSRSTMLPPPKWCNPVCHEPARVCSHVGPRRLAHWTSNGSGERARKWAHVLLIAEGGRRKTEAVGLAHVLLHTPDAPNPIAPVLARLQ